MGNEIDLLTPAEVSKALGISLNTLRCWRVKRRAPKDGSKARKAVPLPFVKPGGRIRYRATDVNSYLQSVTFTPGEPRPKTKRRAA